jgi:glycosyltransferase involved in cell wall biosynthesis
MEELACQLGIENRVIFHGWVDSERVPSLIRDARAVVFPSVWHEPAGLVGLEASANGRALIASRVGGIPEYTEDDSAILIPPGDVNALADAIARLARHPEQAQRMGERGHQLTRSRFSMEHFLRHLESFYEEAFS